MHTDNQAYCKRETRIMTRWSRRYYSLCSRRPMSRQLRAFRAQKMSSSWISVRRAKCCSRCVSEKRPKCLRDILYGLIDGNMAGGSSVCSWRGSGGVVTREAKHDDSPSTSATSVLESKLQARSELLETIAHTRRQKRERGPAFQMGGQRLLCLRHS